MEKIALQHETFEQDLRPQLQEHGVYLLNHSDLTKEQKFYLKDYFEHRIFPVLTPLSVDPAHPFPRMSNLSFEPGGAGGESRKRQPALCSGEGAGQPAPVHRNAGTVAHL